jgi:pimeloyl-ACP methyl ester carboxylesterase
VRYSSADGSDWRLADSLVKELVKLPLDSFSTRREADTYLSRAIVDPAIRAFALQNVAEVAEDKNAEDTAAAKTSTTGGRGKLVWKINLAIIAAELPVIAGVDIGVHGGTVEPFRGPTLFVKGGASRFIVDDVHWPRVNGLFPHATLRTIPGAGHWIHATNPAQLHLEIADFVRAHHS